MPNAFPRILIVDDEVDNLKALERTLRTAFQVVACSSPTEAMEILSREEFAVVVSDQRMPVFFGTDLLAKVASIWPLTSRVILTAHTETKEILDAINRAEIYRYITKPWDNQELLSAIQQASEHYRLLKENRDLIEKLQSKERELLTLNSELERKVDQRTLELKVANEKLSELAMTDPLTRVLNRRAFALKFTEELERASRHKRSLAVAMIDVDHFKQFNDMEGHVYGDEALRKIAQTFTSNLRKSDALGRYGGEEFILIMPETKIHQAKETCERLRAAIEALEFQGKTQPAYLTISVGIAVYPEDGTTPEVLTKAADQALYSAKQAGRNRVMIEKSDSDGSFFIT